MENDTPQFLGMEPQNCPWDSAKVVVFPCPYEKTTSYMKGTVNGPAAIIKSSEQVEFFDSELGLEPSRVGLHTLNALDYTALSESDGLLKTEQTCAKILLEGKLPVVLGGEHTISISPIRAVANHFGKENISILHFDAHSDMRDTYEGNKYSHASIMRRAHEVVDHTYSVGIRAQCLEEREYLNANPNYGVQYDHERAKHGLSVESALAHLPTDNIYVTIDLDYFNPECMPSVGTPVPGGGGWYDTLHFLREISEQRQIVGFDIVELKPDRDERSNFFAAQLAYKLVGYCANRLLQAN